MSLAPGDVADPTSRHSSCYAPFFHSPCGNSIPREITASFYSGAPVEEPGLCVGRRLCRGRCRQDGQGQGHEDFDGGGVKGSAGGRGLHCKNADFKDGKKFTMRSYNQCRVERGERREQAGERLQGLEGDIKNL